VECPVVDDGKVLQLAGIPGAKLQRWKTLTPNKTMGKQQEAKIKKVLMMGRMKSVEDGQSPGPFGFWRLNTFSSPIFNAKPPTLGGRPLLKTGFCKPLILWSIR